MTNDTNNSNAFYAFDLGAVEVRDMNLRTWLTGLAMQAFLTHPALDLSPEEQALAVSRYVEAQLAQLSKNTK